LVPEGLVKDREVIFVQQIFFVCETTLKKKEG